MLTDKELQEWRNEVDEQYRIKNDELAKRIENDDPLNEGLEHYRLGICSEIHALEQVSACLGQIIREKRLPR